MTAPLLHRPRPCPASGEAGPCPFRIDAPAGEFPASRYEDLAATAGAPGAEVPVGGGIFACHNTTDGSPVACAGWLAVCGTHHLGMRFAVSDGRLSPAALQPASEVELFGSYDDMATQQADGVYRPDVADMSRRRAGHFLPTLAKLGGSVVASCDVDERGHHGDMQLGGRRG